MNTRELQIKTRKILRNTPVHFYGVFSAHRLPRVINKFPSCFITNTHTSSGAGVHWTCIYYDHMAKGYFFDSFGMSPERHGHSHWREYMTNTSRNGMWTYNTKRVQSFRSRQCGNYCMTYLYLRSRYPQSVSNSFIVSKINKYLHRV